MHAGLLLFSERRCRAAPIVHSMSSRRKRGWCKQSQARERTFPFDYMLHQRLE